MITCEVECPPIPCHLCFNKLGHPIHRPSSIISYLTVVYNNNQVSDSDGLVLSDNPIAPYIY